MSPADQHAAHACEWCVTQPYGAMHPHYEQGWPEKKAEALEHGWIELTEYAGFLLPCSKHRPADGGVQ